MVIKKYILSSAIAFGVSLSALGQDEIEIIEEDSGEEQINFIDEDDNGNDLGGDEIVIEDVNENEVVPDEEIVEEDLEPASEDLENIDSAEEIVVEDSVEEAQPVAEAEEISDEEMIADYSDGDIAGEVTEGIRIEDIVQPQNEFHFSSFGKADPFVPPINYQDLAKQGEDVIEVELKSVLQRHPLLALKVAGVWQVGTIRKALVTTPTNEGVVVQEGDPMGLRGGKVIGVFDDHVVVREFDLVADGTRQFEDVKVYLVGKRPKRNGKIVFKPGSEPEYVPPQGGEGLLEVMPVDEGEQNVVRAVNAPAEVEQIAPEQVNDVEPAVEQIVPAEVVE